MIAVFYHANAAVSLPAIFSDHMVLQREHPNPVWGKADPGEKVSVSFNGQHHETIADEQGNWRIHLEPTPAGGPHSLVIQASNTLNFEDVLVGEVWLCSGQSNMAWTVAKSNHAAVEIATGANNQIRLLTIPRNGTQLPQHDFEASWVAADSRSISSFSAVGFLFGKRLQQALGVPVGLINSSYGGSSAEAWIPRERLEEAGFGRMLRKWDQEIAAYTDAIHEEKIAEYEDWIASGRPGRRLLPPNDPRTGQHRPANLYNGMLSPIVGYGIKGAIWYQGEKNAGQANDYRTLFPLLITSWRDLWEQGDFSFYWAQLSGFRNRPELPEDSAWARLREAQTMTLSLPNTGQAVTFDAVGFAVAGEDKQFHWAEAKITGMNQVTVSSEQVPNPVALRYAWASHPAANLYDRNGLPVTPFRTDEW